MSDTATTAGGLCRQSPPWDVFERFLTFWVALCIIAGIALGQMIPGFFHVLGEATVAQVNHAGRGARLAHDHPDAAQDRSRGTRARWDSTGAA